MPVYILKHKGQFVDILKSRRDLEASIGAQASDRADYSAWQIWPNGRAVRVQ